MPLPKAADGVQTPGRSPGRSTARSPGRCASARDILPTLLQITDDELVALLCRYFEKRPDTVRLLYEVCDAFVGRKDSMGPLGKADQLTLADYGGDSPLDAEDVVVGDSLAKGGSCGDASNGIISHTNVTAAFTSDVDLLMFGAPQYYCEEDEGKCQVDIIRVGTATGECSVRFRTEDSSAVENIKYWKVDQQVIFGPEVRTRSIDVGIVPNNIWDNVLEFKCELSEAVGAELREHQRSCRVKIIDNDMFPGGKSLTEIMKVKSPKLFRMYCSMNFRQNQVVRNGSIKIMLLSTARTLNVILWLYLQRYLVDTVVKRKDTSDPNHQMLELLFVGVWVFAPQALISFFEFRKYSWKVTGRSLTLLQSNLLRKFLYYTPESLVSAGGSELTEAIKTSSEDVVKGYLSALDLVEASVRIIFLAAYQAATDWTLLVAFLLFPFAIFTFLVCREVRTQYFDMLVHDAEVEIFDSVSHAITHREMVVDYCKRSAVVDQFDKVLKTFYARSAVSGGVKQNNKEFGNVLSALTVGMYVFVGGKQKIDGLIETGVFLSNLRVLQLLEMAFTAGYKHILDINSAFVPLRLLVKLLNMPDENPLKKGFGRQHLERGRKSLTEVREEVLKDGGKKLGARGLIAIDLLPIKMEDVFIKHRASVGASVVELSWPEFKMNQGRIGCVTGSAGCGKSTFLNLLAGMAYSNDGDVIVPTHLGVRCVSMIPILFKGTLMQNISYGVGDGEDKVLLENNRARGICAFLGIPQRTLALLATEEVLEWNIVMSQTEKRLLHIARGFISDPEVLILQMPTRGLAEPQARHIFDMVKMFVDERGIMRDPATFHKRRPRTVVYSTVPNDRLGLDRADDIFLIDRKGVSLLSVEDTKSSWFHTLAKSGQIE